MEKHKINKKKLPIYAAIAVILLGFCWCQNNILTVSEYQFASPKVDDGLDGYRIVQISDLHNKSFGKYNKRLLKKIAELEPDMIVITGDIVDSNHTDVNKAIRCIEGLTEIAPCYYVTGNHEVLLGDLDFAWLMTNLDRCGVTRFDNKPVTIEHGGSQFDLIGLSDQSLEYDVLTSMKLDTSRLNIVLAHEPQFLKSYAEGGADLAFTGHAHGGQFRIPFTNIGFVAPDQGFFPKYTSGIHCSGGCEMVVSRGLGNSIIPLRLFNYPEIVAVTLEKE